PDGAAQLPAAAAADADICGHSYIAGANAADAGGTAAIPRHQEGLIIALKEQRSWRTSGISVLGLWAARLRVICSRRGIIWSCIIAASRSSMNWWRLAQRAPAHPAKWPNR